ncbi:MAG: DUF126 domain-containing protein [Synergistetes bacterium]|nr:DUF126 domain-containing protein [Synergistota bacterium]
MNTEKVVFKCHKIGGGKAEGEAIVSSDDICFYVVDPKTGKVIDKNHSLQGKSIANKVLILPSGKGSSVVQADGLYQLAMNNMAPKAMIIEHPDTVLVVSAIIMDIPIVDKVDRKFYEIISDHDWIEVDADNEKITVIKRSS